MSTILSKFIKHLFLFFERVKYTFRNLTVHGPSFFVRKDVHFVYKVIYFVVYVQVWLAAVVTIRGYYNHYHRNTIRFTTHTDYLRWNTTFASVTVCEVANLDKIWMIEKNLDAQNIVKHDRFVADIAFFSGTCYSCLTTCLDDSFCSTDYIRLTNTFRTKCNDLFISCEWNDEPIDCCKYFKPIQTEYGECYSINNKHTTSNDVAFVTALNGNQLGILDITVSQDYELFLHAPEDIPFWNMEYDRRARVAYGAESLLTYSIMDVVNEPEVSLITPEDRECRFPEEIPDNYVAFKYYSYSVCINQCRIDAQLELCNCTHHLSPSYYRDRYCDLEGLQCLTKHDKTLRKLKVPESNDTGLDCDCLPSCTEPDYNIVSKKLIEPEKDLRVKTARFLIANKPNQRHTRQVARTTLDLVVAMGNCFGLCFGGSLLSIVEIAYYLCLKRWKHAKGK